MVLRALLGTLRSALPDPSWTFVDGTVLRIGTQVMIVGAANPAVEHAVVHQLATRGATTIDRETITLDRSGAVRPIGLPTHVMAHQPGWPGADDDPDFFRRHGRLMPSDEISSTHGPLAINHLVHVVEEADEPLIVHPQSPPDALATIVSRSSRVSDIRPIGELVRSTPAWRITSPPGNIDAIADAIESLT